MGEKTENLEEENLQQGLEPTINSTHMCDNGYGNQLWTTLVG